MIYCDYEFEMAAPDEGHVTVFTYCPNGCGENKIVMTNAQFAEYERKIEDPAHARKIQDIFPDPDFTPEQREFLMTGLCHDCQEMVFGKPIKEDEE